MNIAEVKELLKKDNVEISLIEKLMQDKRKGVQQALNTYFKKKRL